MTSDGYRQGFVSFAHFLLYFFSKINFLKKFFQEYHQNVKQFGEFVGPDLGTNCLPRLSADDTGRQRVKF